MFLAQHRERLADEIANHEIILPERAPLGDPFLVTSVLQKSLRRGDAVYAHRAALALLHLDASRFWRRLVISACEDFGLSDLRLSMEVIAAASDKTWRRQSGGDERIALFLIDKLVRSPRDRRTDEIYMLAVALSKQRGPREALERLGMSSELTRAIGAAIDIVKECETVMPFRGKRGVIAKRCDAAIAKMAYQGWAERELEAACMQARRTSQCCLPVMLPLVKTLMPSSPVGRKVVTRQHPALTSISGWPSYALDGYTRAGRIALMTLSKRNLALAEAVRPLPSSKERMEALTNLLFAVEGGVCTTEISDPLYDELKQYSLGCWTGLPSESLSNGLNAMAGAVPELNAIRADVASWI